MLLTGALGLVANTIGPLGVIGQIGKVTNPNSYFGMS
jgi:hypothetical protein